jgi:5'-nucleotidase
VRILVTNDDGVRAPGIAALVRSLSAWMKDTADVHELIVVAPMVNHSGASSAVGTVYEKSSLAYERVRIDGAEDVIAFGLDASPALSVIVGVLGGFGPRPDVIVSGINLGANVGRSVLHSGTVGAVLTGAQLGVRGLAVSLRVGPEPHPFETAGAAAAAILPALMAGSSPICLNLNVPAVTRAELRGIRRGWVSGAGIVRSADHVATHEETANSRTAVGGPFDSGEDHGVVRLELGSAVPALPTSATDEDDSDAALIAAGFASITPLCGVMDDLSDAAGAVTADALRRAQDLLSA